MTGREERRQEGPALWGRARPSPENRGMCGELQLARPTGPAGPAGVATALRAEGHLGARFRVNRGPTSRDRAQASRGCAAEGSWD